MDFPDQNRLAFCDAKTVLDSATHSSGVLAILFSQCQNYAWLIELTRLSFSKHGTATAPGPVLESPIIPIISRNESRRHKLWSKVVASHVKWQDVITWSLGIILQTYANIFQIVQIFGSFFMSNKTLKTWNLDSTAPSSKLQNLDLEYPSPIRFNQHLPASDLKGFGWKSSHPFFCVKMYQSDFCPKMLIYQCACDKFLFQNTCIACKQKMISLRST